MLFPTQRGLEAKAWTVTPPQMELRVEDVGGTVSPDRDEVFTFNDLQMDHPGHKPDVQQQKVT